MPPRPHRAGHPTARPSWAVSGEHLPEHAALPSAPGHHKDPHRSLQPLATLSFCLGASAIAPALIYSLFWRRYTRTGLLSTLIGGSLTVLVLMPGTRLVSGTPTAAFPQADFNWFPFSTTGLVSVPLGFAFGWLGTLLSGRREARQCQKDHERIGAEILAGPEPRVR